MAFVENPWTGITWGANPWTDNPWSESDVFEFTNTGASLDPYISVTGTPEILWTWSDGSTSNVAAPGIKNLTGTHTLLITPWSAVTRLDFDGRNLTGTWVNKAWEGVSRIYCGGNSTLTGGFKIYPWENITYLSLYSCDFNGCFEVQTWLKLIGLYAHGNAFSSISGSFQTQTKMTTCRLQDSAITSQTEIDKLYSDLLVNAADAGRVAVCEVNTSGGTMATPSAAGLSDVDDLVNIHSWTVTHA